MTRATTHLALPLPSFCTTTAFPSVLLPRLTIDWVGQGGMSVLSHTSGRMFGPARMIQRATARPTYAAGLRVESGFEPVTLRLRGRDLTIRPPWPIRYRETSHFCNSTKDQKIKGDSLTVT
ncbi:hypothetical protein AVEN_119751-1 [Araneus ventricosus]|uniref:Uncharacterized protein n=1 Tax=Araneus ventricosus TaxID=182803 RepID=A0A4Y2FDM3_ARAVE|nr:hypothetical protein AVEN_119751-1 [Araneus ventricosus]